MQHCVITVEIHIDSACLVELENVLGLTVPCRTTASCFTRSILREIADTQVSESTIAVERELYDVERKHTEDLIRLTKTKREGVERHELSIRFCTFLTHLRVVTLTTLPPSF